jgi:hypothetical protein
MFLVLTRTLLHPENTQPTDDVNNTNQTIGTENIAIEADDNRRCKSKIYISI